MLSSLGGAFVFVRVLRVRICILELCFVRFGLVGILYQVFNSTQNGVNLCPLIQCDN